MDDFQAVKKVSPEYSTGHLSEKNTDILVFRLKGVSCTNFSIPAADFFFFSVMFRLEFAVGVFLIRRPVAVYLVWMFLVACQFMAD